MHNESLKHQSRSADSDSDLVREHAALVQGRNGMQVKLHMPHIQPTPESLIHPLQVSK